MYNWYDIDYRSENLKTGEIIEISSNKSIITVEQKSRNSRFVIQKKYYQKTGKLSFYGKYYDNISEKYYDPWVGIGYCFSQTANGELTGINDYEINSVISLENIMLILKEKYLANSQFPINPDSIIVDFKDNFYYHHPYGDSYCTITSTQLHKLDSLSEKEYHLALEIELTSGIPMWLITDKEGNHVKISPKSLKRLYSYFPAWIEPQKNIEKALTNDAFANEQFNIGGINCDSTNNNFITRRCKIESFKNLLYRKKDKISGQMTTIWGDANSGFEKQNDRYPVALFDTKGNLYRSQVIDSTGFSMSVTEYNVDHSLIESITFDKNKYLKYNIQDYIDNRLIKDLKLEFNVGLNQYEADELKNGVIVSKYWGYPNGNYYNFSSQKLTGNEIVLWKVKGSFRDYLFEVSIDGNTGKFIYLRKSKVIRD